MTDFDEIICDVCGEPMSRYGCESCSGEDCDCGGLGEYYVCETCDVCDATEEDYW